MSTADKSFTIAGITTHSREGVTVTKVRYGNDLVRLSKMLSSNRKVGVSRDLGGRGDGFLDAVRVDLVELPGPLTKLEALQFLAGHGSFQSADDQFLVREELVDRQKRAQREAKRATLTVNAGKLIKAAKAKAPVTA